MRITKLVHSCLLVELPEATILVDPGVMSAAAVQAADISRLDAILVTHSHGDHFDTDLVKTLHTRFPKVTISGPPDVLESVRELGLPIADIPTYVKTFTSPHEAGDPLFVTPAEQGYHVGQLLTHPGDSHHFAESMPVLALPVTAPWGASTAAMKLAISLKPRYVIPIHDWHWNDDARRGMYAQFAGVLELQGIQFLSLENGQSIDLDVS